MKKKAFLILLAFVLLSGAMYLLVEYGFETLFSDPAARLAYQVRDEAAALRRSGAGTRTFEYRPASWPEGIKGDYHIAITEDANARQPGRRSIGVAPGLTGPVRYTTYYHLNFVEVPYDLVIAHRKGEATLVTLEMRRGLVILTDLK